MQGVSSSHPQIFYLDDRFLPKPEITKFNGDPLQYRNFKTNFETHIESKFRDPKIVLCLLLQHCDVKARNRLQHFSEKDQFGYQMALERLKREFGQPCIIAEACEQRLKAASAIKSNDLEGIKNFAELLEKTMIILEDIQHYGSINSLDTMTQLLNKLPYETRKQWVKESVIIEHRFSEVAKFKHFVAFVEREAEAANSLYGRRVLGGHSKQHNSSKSSKSSFHSSVASRDEQQPPAKKTIKCYFCDSPDHFSQACPRFIEAPVADRSKFVKCKGLCFRCLSSRHRTRFCRRQNSCTVESCEGTFHNTLLHLHNSSSKNESSSSEPAAVLSTCASSFSSSEPLSKAVYLCVVPVKVRYQDQEVLTYAFLDQGSTHTFCDKRLVKR